MNEWMNERTNGWKKERKKERMNEWMNEWLKGSKLQKGTKKPRKDLFGHTGATQVQAYLFEDTD